MALAYCNVTTHLTDVFPDVENYQQKMTLEGWTIVSGQTYTYYKYATGQINKMFQGGAPMTPRTSIALVEATSSSYWYDSDNDICYVRPSTNVDPDTLVMESGEDWDTFKTTMRKNAMEFIDARLRYKFSTPLRPRVNQSHTSDDYDVDIVRACAFITCAFIVQRRNPADPIAKNLMKQAWDPLPEPGEQKGILNEILDGDSFFSNQPRPGSIMVYPYASNTITRGPDFFGEYNGKTFKRWRVQVDTAGAPGTGDYKVSFDGTGSSWDLTDQEMIDVSEDEYRMYISAGIYVRWPIGIAQVSGEYWDVELFPLTDGTETGKIGNIEAYR